MMDKLLTNGDVLIVTGRVSFEVIEDAKRLRKKIVSVCNKNVKTTLEKVLEIGIAESEFGVFEYAFENPRIYEFDGKYYDVKTGDLDVKSWVNDIFKYADLIDSSELRKFFLDAVIANIRYDARHSYWHNSMEMKAFFREFKTRLLEFQQPMQGEQQSTKPSTQDKEPQIREILAFLGNTHPQEGQLLTQDEFERLIRYVVHMVETNALPEIIEPINAVKPPAEIIRYAIYSLRISLTGKGKKLKFPYIEFLQQVFVSQFQNWNYDTLKKKFSEKPNGWEYWSGNQG